MSSSATSRPGAMSLLDKYASINTSIEDARRRVGKVRSDLDRSNDKIGNLREERNGMLVETEYATTEMSRLDADLKEAKNEHRTKLSEKERAQRENQIAKSEHGGMRRRMDDERMDFLERCREFRASCKRMRVAASILVLDGGGNFDAKDASDEQDLWRRLQEEDFSDDDEEEDNGGDSNSNIERSNKRKHKKADPEVEQTENDEKESRQALIEAECTLHAERMTNAEAIKRSNARTSKLTQQRAQLQRHRQEVEELEREIQSVKDSIVEENQLKNTFEKECHKRKQRRRDSANSHNNASYSNNFNPPPEESRPGNNPYNNRTPQTSSSSGYQQQQRSRGGAVTNPYTNPYKQTSRPHSAPNQREDPPRNAPNNNQRGQNGRTNTQPMYASDMLRGSIPECGQGQRNRQAAQHPHRGGRVRNQRQFGTTVGVSLGSGSGMTDELEECMAAFSKPESSSAKKKRDSGKTFEDDIISDVSSTSSDEDILSFNLGFGNK